jgi:RNA polymerase sigma factor (sigma-70 family)
MLSKKDVIKIYNDHNRELLSYLSRLVTDQTVCDDLMHDTFERIIRYSEQHEIDISTVRALLYKTAHNLAVNHLRSKKTSSSSFDDSNPAIPGTPGDLSDNIMNMELSDRIKRFMNELDPEGRSIFVLHKDFGKTYDEISSEIGISARTVRRRMKNMIDSLEETLKNEGFL